MTQPDKTPLAVNSSVADWERRVLAGRELFVRQFAMAGSNDAKRLKAWDEYGFKPTLTFDDLYKMYSRGGVAFGAVTKLVSRCWLNAPEVIEGEKDDTDEAVTEWETATAKVLSKVNAWDVWKEVDRRRLVGRYAALILRFADNKDFDQPVTTGRKVLVECVPVWASALKAGDVDQDQQSERYGKPKFWTYTPVDYAGNPMSPVEIHSDRLFIVGDPSPGAIAFLEPVYNALVSLEKVEGGSGESFLKNAARQISINYDPEVDLVEAAKHYGMELPAFKAQFDDAVRKLNRANDMAMMTQGATVTPLVTQVADPEPTYRVNLQTVAAGVDIPSKILVGQQTGERASTEDERYMSARCQSRRDSELSREITDFIRHLQRCGVVDAKDEIVTVWTSLLELTGAEKLATSKTMAEINTSAMDQGQAAFTVDEIRAAAGYDKLTERIEPPLPEPVDGGAE